MEFTNLSFEVGKLDVQYHSRPQVLHRLLQRYVSLAAACGALVLIVAGQYLLLREPIEQLLESQRLLTSRFNRDDHMRFHNNARFTAVETRRFVLDDTQRVVEERTAVALPRLSFHAIGGFSVAFADPLGVAGGVMRSCVFVVGIFQHRVDDSLNTFNRVRLYADSKIAVLLTQRLEETERRCSHCRHTRVVESQSVEHHGQFRRQIRISRTEETLPVDVLKQFARDEMLESRQP